MQVAGFIGLQSYSEAQASYFFGRNNEIEQLTRLVESNTLTIVFGKSGTGKTSLLNAGVFPRLRKNYCLPFRIRLEFEDESPDLVTQIKNVLRSEIDKYGFHTETYPETETLWQYFHREPLWKSITPILVFDQFEEIFTLAQKNERFKKKEFSLFWEELSDLIENSIPNKLNDEFLYHKERINYNYQTQKVKAVFSFREEYLPEFESITSKIPSIKSSRFRLMPMNGNQAYEVISKTWGNNINPEQAEKIVSYFTNHTQKDKYNISEIEPSLLSQVCTYIDKERVLEGSLNISSQLLDKYPKEFIFRSIYNEAMEQSNSVFPELALKKNEKKDPKMNLFLEDKLITTEGYRTRYSLKAQDQNLMPGIDILIKKYFLRYDNGSVELTHDALTPLIKADRELRSKKMAADIANKKARKKALLILFFTAITALITYFWVTNAANNRKKELIKTNLALMNRQLALNKSIDSLNDLKNIKDAPAVVLNPAPFINTDSLYNYLSDSISRKNEDFKEKLSKARNENMFTMELINEHIKKLNARIKRSDSLNSKLKNSITDLQLQISNYKILLQRSQLNYENLRDSFYAYRLKYPVQFISPQKTSVMPDDNSLQLKLQSGSSNDKKDKIPDNLVIYLIPVKGNNKLIGDSKNYEINCNDSKLKMASGSRRANNYNGVYFFNNVPPGRYLIKICSYYGNFDVITRKKGPQVVKLQLAPPVQ
jgi:hypothetical protein